MKRKLKRIIPLVVFIGLFAYFVMTPIGALRLGIALTGYPVKAVTSVITFNSPHPKDNQCGYSLGQEANQIGYTLKNPPYEKISDSALTNWLVTRHSIFYFAKYAGWG